MAATQPDRASESSRGIRLLVGLMLVGAVVSVSLGVYGGLHEPTFEPIYTFGFPELFDMKAWFTTAAATLALVQLVTALRMYGRIGKGPASAAVGVTHRVSGVAAVLVSLPVGYHCLWSLGFQKYDARVLVHSLLGCAFYGLFVTKMLVLRSSKVPGWALPVLGGLVFTALVALWWTAAFWYFVYYEPH